MECDCPIDAVASMIGRKWIIVLLRDFFLGKTKFKEFLENKNLSNKVLSQKLKEMQELGLITKTTKERDVTYSLTPQAKKLKPVLRELVKFGKDFCSSNKNYKQLLENLN